MSARSLTSIRKQVEKAIKKAEVEVSPEQSAAILDATEPMIRLTQTWDLSESRDFAKAVRAVDERNAKKGDATLGDVIGGVEQAKHETSAKRLKKLPIGASRLGGLPDLPPGFEWPRVKKNRRKDGKLLSNKRMPFVAQLDLSELPHWKDSPLPKSGWLYVFVFLSNDAPEGCAVTYHDGPREELTRDKSKANDDDLAPTSTGQRIYDLLLFKPDVLPSVDWDKVARQTITEPEEQWRPIMKGKEKDELLQQWDAGERPKGVKVTQSRFGPDRIPWRRVDRTAVDIGRQDLPRGLMRIDRDLSADGFQDECGHLLGQPTWDESANQMAAYDWGHNRREGDWVNLLELHSMGSFMWSDAGYLNLLIRRPALEAGDFGDVLHWVSSS